MTLKFQEIYKTDEEACQINSRAKGITAIVLKFVTTILKFTST
jgi:hypothetical protein